MNVAEPRIYEFDDFRLDAGRRLLLQRGEPVPLKPKVFDTLLYLARHQGRVIEKDELMRAIWPDAI
ncbi:MAG TPA: winged helix-turn-helix domain-containing protein, partial [Candidatus Solibacter sp.]|nr:winged helix-turn-helix domain-containing protein [Candidatus Solibacter sp.]